jgi:hypothetical protein
MKPGAYQFSPRNRDRPATSRRRERALKRAVALLGKRQSSACMLLRGVRPQRTVLMTEMKGQVAEVLSKVICHNICCSISAMDELGLEML